MQGARTYGHKTEHNPKEGDILSQGVHTYRQFGNSKSP